MAKELGDRVPSIDKTCVEGLIKDLIEAINQDNYECMKLLTGELQQALTQVDTAVYSQAGVSTDSSSNSGSSSDDAIDADFVQSK